MVSQGRDRRSELFLGLALGLGITSALTACTTDPNRVSGGACQTNQNCFSGEQCVSSRCVPAVRQSCKSDEACSVGFYCSPIARACLPIEATGCATDDTCPSDQRCNTLTGTCMDGRRSCTSDAQCTSIGKHCDLAAQQCVDCMGDEDCTGPSVCVDRACVDPTTSMCTSDSGCAAPDTVCEGLRCVPGCHQAGSPLVCRLGETCSTRTGRCESEQSTCTTDTECAPPSTVCESGQCVPACTQLGGLSCTGGNVCNTTSGRCQPGAPCHRDGDCGVPAGVCENQTCVAGCAQGGAPCTGSDVCDRNTGRCVAVQGRCTMDVDCGAPNQVCQNNQCVSGCGHAGAAPCAGNTTCNTSTGRCDAGTPACTSDASCSAPATVCNGGACVPGCSTTGCGANETCNMATGRCAPRVPVGAAPLNAVCATNTDCQSGVCFDFAGTIGKKCVSSCGSSNDCPASFTCYDYNGAKMCLSAQLLPGATFSVANGGACTQGIACHSDYCPGNTCVDTCTESGDCGRGQTCKWSEYATNSFIGACNGPAGNGAAGAACRADQDCRSGVCYGSGICGDLCASSTDCGQDSICGLVNYSVCTLELASCFEWQPNFVRTCIRNAHGNGAIGSACTTAEQCRSNLCYIPNGQCTDSCSRDSDCPATYVCGVEDYGELPVSGGSPTPIFLNVCKPRS